MLRVAGAQLVSNLAASSVVLPLRYMSQQSSNKETTYKSLQPYVPETIDPKRIKGFGKKLMLRAVNRNVVSRITRRAMIGIPILGIYLAQRLLRKDLAQALDKSNPEHIRKGFGFLSGVDAVDLMAQSIIITSLGASIFMPGLYGTLSGIGLAEIANYADKASIAAALTSSMFGTYLEMKKEKESSKE